MINYQCPAGINSLPNLFDAALQLISSQQIKAQRDFIRDSDD